MPTQRTLAYSFDLTRGECSLYFEWIKKQWSLPEFHAMQSRLHLKSSRAVVEVLEGRSLLSGFKPLVPSGLRPAMIGPVNPTIATDPAGIAAIMSALEGGMGREWVSLIRAEVRNPLAVIAGFSTGKYTSYSISGLTAETPSVQPAFAGQPYDQILAAVAGAPGDPVVEHRDPGPGRPRLPQDHPAPIQGLAASEVPLRLLDTNAGR